MVLLSPFHFPPKREDPIGDAAMCPLGARRPWPRPPHLHLHGLLDAGRDVDVLDLVAQAADAPLFRRLVDGVHDVVIQRLPFLERGHGTEVRATRKKLTRRHARTRSQIQTSTQADSRTPEHFVEGELAQLGAHGGLGQLSDGVLRVLYAVTRLERRNTQLPSDHGCHSTRP